VRRDGHLVHVKHVKVRDDLRWRTEPRAGLPICRLEDLFSLSWIQAVDIAFISRTGVRVVTSWLLGPTSDPSGVV
jgi:hypothetical protein